MPEPSLNFMLAIGFTVVVVVLVVGTLIAHLVISSKQLRKDKMALSAAQEQLLAYNKKLQAMAEHEALVEERQRREIAGNLHDRINQTLALSKIKLSTLPKDELSQEARESLVELEDLIKRILRDVRSLIVEISPPALYDLGPAAAIESLAKAYEQQYQIRFNLTDDGSTNSIGEKYAAFIYKAARELMVNVIKHARAKQVWIDLKNVDGRVRLEIKDNGIGFDPDRLNSATGAGFGLFNIKDRLDFYNGKMIVDSHPGKGSQFLIEVPLKAENGNEKDQSSSG